MKFIPITFKANAANCPFCGVYSKIIWGELKIDYPNYSNFVQTKYVAGKCSHCEEITVWEKLIKDKTLPPVTNIIVPNSGLIPPPNNDLPDELRADYLEAGRIVELSPRGAVAILRLILQKLCKHLGESGKDINSDIGALVNRGLNPSIQMALDSVRVIGNNAVHPGVIDLSDDRETAYRIFGLINFIVNAMITQPREIDEFYHAKVTGGVKDAIDRRDKK
ncbi:DUF4145 domain-containing protein [Sphingobacterium sp.]|uniref:DUF4145 domain-containing protein n=1 Tax=Sphingobacterium sp. TaxID=341027 RepID=UPI0028A6ABF2|nr:DUF4145 domain-containing protein [Sphingobacterium sp.]